MFQFDMRQRASKGFITFFTFLQHESTKAIKHRNGEQQLQRNTLFGIHKIHPPPVDFLLNLFTCPS